MDWRGGLALSGRVARALARMGTDRVLDWRSGALPRSADQLARAQIVNALLGRGGDARPRVVRVHPTGVRFESSNCQNFLVALEWDGPSDGSQALPGTLYVKLPCRERVTRAFANALGFWAVECAVARRVAPVVPIRVPRVYAVAERRSRFVLLLENLAEEPHVRLYCNRNMAAGTDVERARLCLDTFATLHAAFWDWDEPRRDALLPLALHPYLAPGARAVSRALASAAVGPAHRVAPAIFTASHAALCRKAVAKWDAVVDAWYRGPVTLIHGDSHLANCFEYTRDGRTRMGMLDFQGAHWGHGIRDAQYFLVNSLEPDLLARHEPELIDHYLAALARRGVRLGAADARERYRACSLQTLLVAVVSLGLGPLTERDTTLRTVLARSVAAVDRLGCGDWLERL